MMGRTAPPPAVIKDQDEVSGDGTSSFFSAGRGVQDFAGPPGAVVSAVAEAMDDLKFTVTKRRREGTVSQVEGRTADDRAVTITLRPRVAATRVSCRIGWFGDPPLSRTFLERVGVRLGTLPPAAIPEQPPSAPSSNPLFSRDAVPDSEILRDFAEAPYRERVDP
jgi:hypothetical protein